MAKDRVIEKLASLTEQQELALDSYATKWADIGVGTHSQEDHEVAKEGVRLIYNAAGLVVPDRLIWFSSPMREAHSAEQRWREEGRSVRFEIRKAAHLSRATDRLQGETTDELFVKIYNKIAQKWSLAWSHEANEDQELYADNIDKLNRKEAWEEVPGWAMIMSKTATIQIQLGPRYVWVGLEDFGNYLMGAPVDSARKGFMLLAQSCRRFWPFKDAVILVERPILLQVDENGRLHSGSGPAKQYRDGESTWAWRGVQVPSFVITDPAKITVDQILAEKNVEIRRVMIERYGVDRFMLDSDTAVVDANEEHGAELIKINLPHDPEKCLCALKLRCASSNAVYIVMVPPEMRTATQALAWTARVAEEDYILLAER